MVSGRRWAMLAGLHALSCASFACSAILGIEERLPDPAGASTVLDGDGASGDATAGNDARRAGDDASDGSTEATPDGSVTWDGTADAAADVPQDTSGDATRDAALDVVIDARLDVGGPG
jgi:hypothetical protein